MKTNEQSWTKRATRSTLNKILRLWWGVTCLALWTCAAFGQSVKISQEPPTNVVSAGDLFLIDSVSGTNWVTRRITSSNFFNGLPYIGGRFSYTGPATFTNINGDLGYGNDQGNEFAGKGRFLSDVPVPGAPLSASPVPWLGYNTWDDIGTGAITGTMVSNTVTLWKTNGMMSAGWNIFWLDDGWDTNIGVVMAVDTNKFPNVGTFDSITNNNGIQYIGTFVHKQGGLFGIYASYSYTSLAGEVGALWNVAGNMMNFKNWGIDAIKVDNPVGTGYMGGGGYSDHQAAREFGYWAGELGFNPILLEVYNNLHTWTPLEMNCWQQGSVNFNYDTLPHCVSNLDFFDNEITRYQLKPSLAIGPGHFQDLDLNSGSVAAGTGTNMFSATMSIAAAMVSPYLIGQISTNNIPYATNQAIISLIKDPLCQRAVQIVSNANYRVRARALTNGAVAVFLINYSGSPQAISLTAAQLTPFGLPQNFVVSVSNSWAWPNGFVGWFTTNFSATVPANEIDVYTLNPNLFGNATPTIFTNAGAGTGDTILFSGQAPTPHRWTITVTTAAALQTNAELFQIRFPAIGSNAVVKFTPKSVQAAYYMGQAGYTWATNSTTNVSMMFGNFPAINNSGVNSLIWDFTIEP